MLKLIPALLPAMLPGVIMAAEHVETRMDLTNHWVGFFSVFFFCGVVLCAGGLGFLGYLSLAFEMMYTGWGATNTNIAVELLSAIVDNISVMFAVLTM